MLNKKVLLLLVAIVLSSLFQFSFCQVNTTFSYTLNNKASTSAGIFKTDGTLVRTLWSGVIKEAGTYAIKWDGTNDSMLTMPVDNYAFKVLSNNVKYEWQGVIGNTSKNQTGSEIHRSLNAAINMVIVGNTAYYTSGYGEGGPPQYAFDLKNPQVKKNPFSTINNMITNYMCTDGNNIYWASNDNYSTNENNSFVYATKVSDNSLVDFSKGDHYKVTYGTDFPSVVDFLSTPNSHPSGIAVSSNYLFVSHKSLDYVSVVDKVTGALVRTLPFVKPEAITSDGDNLWVSYNTTTTTQTYPSGQYFEDSHLGNMSAANAFDGGFSTSFLSNSSNAGYVGIDALSPKTSSMVQIYPAAGNANRLIGAVIEGSNDNSQWTTLATITSLPTDNSYNSYSIPTSTYRYWRVYNSNTNLAVSEVIFYTDPAISTTTSNVKKFPINADGTLGTATISILGLSDPADLKINNNTLYIVDGGDSQQIKTYNNETGEAGWILGQPGGNLSSPVVSNDRFAFWTINGTGNKLTYGGLAFAADGSFWVSDPGNSRMQHYDADRNYIERVAYVGANYTLAIDPANHSRVMNGLREFQVDYTSPIRDSWTLKYNWAGTFRPGYAIGDGIKYITTLSNGRTYGSVLHNGDYEIVELLPSTGIRYTGMTYRAGAKKMYPDGSIADVTGTTANETETWTKMTLKGFDDLNNPIYSSPVTVASTNRTGATTPQLSGAKVLPMELTSTGAIVCFKGDKQANESRTYHLGAINPSNGEWIWKASPGTFADYSGPFPDNGDFDAGNGSWYQGNTAMSIERSIFWNFTGEAWKGGQTNKWNQFYDNGLFVGQFGTTSYDYLGEAPAMMAGNAYGTAVIKEGDDYYIYHNDESHHGGFHRWKVTGLNTIQEQTIPITTAFVRTEETPAIVGEDLMVGLSYRSVLENNTAGWTRSPNVESSNWSARTNVFNYQKRKSVDIYIANNQSGAFLNTISRDLGSNSNLTAWTLSGKLTYNNCDANGPDENGAKQYFDVLDNNGKIIVRFYQSINYNDFNITVYANNSIIARGSVAEMKFLTKTLQPLEINKTGNTITVSYAGKNPVAVNAYEPDANISNPTTMLLTFSSNGVGNSYAKTTGISNFKFVQNALTTPNPPNLSADDNNNTLSASDILGVTEILVSENDGAFATYTGQINVGNVSRPAGYWKFKIKSATGRNESAVVNSPSFSEIVNPDVPTLAADDAANTLSASYSLGTSEILVCENGGPYLPYVGQINVGNVTRPAGYWKFKIKSATGRNESAEVKFKIKSATGRNESAVVKSPEFTEIVNADVPTLAADDAANTLSASHALGTSEILVCENGGPYLPYVGQINVGNVTRPAGYWKFKIKSATGRNESAVVKSPEFTAIVNPDAPTLSADDVSNTLSASNALGTSEILVCENGGPYLPYVGPISVGNVSRPVGYWKFKIKSATGRTESSVVKSPEFTAIVNPDAPTLIADDVSNTLSASNALGTSEILVCENGGPYLPYVGQINVGNVTRPAGYWKFKIKSATGRNESAVVKSPEFTAIVNPDAPTLIADDVSNTLSASNALGTSEILVCENGGPYLPYVGPINVGNVSRPVGYWKFKIKSATGRNESAVVKSPQFTAIVNPDVPTLIADDAANTLSASHALGTAEILVCENGGPYLPYVGPISVGNVSRPIGYWKFKIKSATGRNESTVVNSPVFTEMVTPVAPMLAADDAANTLNASHALGSSEILVSENGGAFVAYSGKINVGNVTRAAGYWKFKIKSATGRNESEVVNSPAFTQIINPGVPTLTADDAANTLSASHALGTAEILVCENGGPYLPYVGPINVGNVTRPMGYWKFKIKSATGRNESAIASSPAFTEIVTPVAPTLAADDVANTLSASHALGSSEILVSENGGAFVAYTGKINVGNVAREAGYWKFKIRAAIQRSESDVINSPQFTTTIHLFPIIFTNVKATQVNKEVLVEWVAVGEWNMDKYVVEKSADGLQFSPIGRVTSKNNPISSNYSLLDQTPIVGINYYRIKSLDKAGEIKFSNIVSVKYFDANPGINVFPNPIIGNNVSIQSTNIPAGVYAISLVNNAGQTILKESVEHAGGAFNHSIALNNSLAKGMYILKFSGQDLNVNKKLLK